MTYIDYLNRFHQYLESNALPLTAQLLYFKLLHIFNRAGWPPYIRVDNPRLMYMLGNCSEKALTTNRSKLMEAGFIRFRSGTKGMPSRYTLCQVSLFPGREKGALSAGESAGEKGALSGGISAGKSEALSGQVKCGETGIPGRGSAGEKGALSAGESEGVSGGETGGRTFSHNKTETKTKKKTSPPKPPKGASFSTYDIEELEELSRLDIPVNL